MLQTYDISDEILQSIQEVIENQRDNPDLEVYIYTPDELSISAEVTDRTRASLYPTKNEIVEYRNMHPSNWIDIAKGRNMAGAAEEISLLALGFAGSVGAVFSFGLSLLSIYEKACGMYVEYGSSDDYLGMWHVYDKLEKFTSVNTGNSNWVTACKTYKVWLDYVKIHTFTVSTGKDIIDQYSINKTQYSNHWYDADTVAQNNVFNQMVVDEPITLTLGNGHTTLIL